MVPVNNAFISIVYMESHITSNADRVSERLYLFSIIGTQNLFIY